MKNIHILPTDKPSRLYKFKDKLIKNDLIGLYDFEEKEYIAQNIYITSDEKPRQEEWCLDLDTNTVFKIGNWKTNRAKKIIITDNEALIKDSIQAIDDEFLEWFVKNPSCEWVRVNDLYNYTNESTQHIGYKIIIPKEESKKYLEKEMFVLEQELDIPSHLRWHNCKPKQETLEEIAERLSNTTDEFNMFIAGAKWQQEQEQKTCIVRKKFLG